MNKDSLIRKVAAKHNMNNKDAKDIIESTFDYIIDELSSGGSATVVGFGTFEVRKRVARIGRNPQTGEKLEIPETKTPAFQPGKRLRDAIKQTA